MSAIEFKPLEDADSVISIGGLSVENGSDTLLVNGSLELARDEKSIERARQLAELFSKIANKLDADVKAGLTSDLVEESAVTEISNPF
ncbi:hypothetical protein [Mesorhizobium sp. SP-1A]|uniref:hypothetical protein n=1 Tax=Mesorhizobium sp. SP-1A TaxID=3077840 RepID=UPI0028F70226|nr:hypothetical protein [Mesorhizobium sp. SP-1A]